MREIDHLRQRLVAGAPACVNPWQNGSTTPPNSAPAAPFASSRASAVSRATAARFPRNARAVSAA